MARSIVIGSPTTLPYAQQVAQGLAHHGIDAALIDCSDIWEKGWRDQIAGRLAADAFIVVCIGPDAGSDSVLSNVLWKAAPVVDDLTGRFIFARFDGNGPVGEAIAPFLNKHFTVQGADAGSIARHIREHEQALALRVKMDIQARAAREQAALEAAARSPLRETTGVGSGRTGRVGVGAGEPRRIEGVGAGRDDNSSLDRILRDYVATRSTSPPATAPAAAGAPPPSPKPRPPLIEAADAMAFAPCKLRRETGELVRVSVFQAGDKAKVMKNIRLADPRARQAGAAQTLGAVARGATVSALIQVRGGECDTQRIDAAWTGEPLDFDFLVEADSNPAVSQAVIKFRLLVDGAQVGTIVFVRPLSRARKSRAPSKINSTEKLQRVKRVFLSYSSADRAIVSVIAGAYGRAGIPCFFDRTSLRSGEEWSPRLLKEIGRSDLFHLCWSKQSAVSDWVEREANFALMRRRKSWSRRPDITIQMLDGPPWAPHPPSLDALNFDDYARAAIVGYARGDG